MKAGIICMVLVVIVFQVSAQKNDTTKHLGVSSNRTTSVLFPASIVSVDRGSERIIVQKSINNVLRVRAASAFGDTTSLTVITSDGILYSFLVHYESSPENLTIRLSNSEAVDKDTSLVAIAQKVLQLKNTLYGINTKNGMVQLALLGVYTTGDLIICKLRIENSSSLSYGIDELQVFTDETQVTRRRSSQERPVKPLLSFNQDAIVRDKGIQAVAIILPKPLLSHSHRLNIVVNEKDGGRTLSLKVSARFLLTALTLH